jgi:DNA end-binding protein Ku
MVAGRNQTIYMGVHAEEVLMAQRPIWRGYLRLALVTCPVALYAANHERGSLHFNLINPKTGNRVRMITQDAETEEELSRRDLVKGYEFKKDNYIILTDDDFETARVESSTTINVDKFVDIASIDPIYYDASYYLAPDGNAGKDVYAVLREAISGTGKMALARVVIARRERAIGIVPMGQGLVAHTLHEERDLNDARDVFEDTPTGKSDPEMVRLATQLIERQAGKYDPADVEDRYEARLRDVIEAKLKGKGIEPVDQEEPERSNVIDLMGALRRSLGQNDAPPAKRPPAAKKAAPEKGAAKVAAKKGSGAPAHGRARRKA